MCYKALRDSIVCIMTAIFTDCLKILRPSRIKGVLIFASMFSFEGILFQTLSITAIANIYTTFIQTIESVLMAETHF